MDVVCHIFVLLQTVLGCCEHPLVIVFTKEDALPSPGKDVTWLTTATKVLKLVKRFASESVLPVVGKKGLPFCSHIKVNYSALSFVSQDQFSQTQETAGDKVLWRTLPGTLPHPKWGWWKSKFKIHGRQIR